jgi:hypothetical protein
MTTTDIVRRVADIGKNLGGREREREREREERERDHDN